jgi:phage tail-like protein
MLPLNTVTSLAAGALGIRMDPYGSFNFLVEIDGILSGGFSDVGGLQIETETETVKEGGVNDHVHILPKGTKYQNITLKHGIGDLDLLWRWYKDVVDGKIERKNGIIFLLDNSRLPAMWWEFYDAYPVKWTGPDLKADTGSIAFETIDLVHSGLTKPDASTLLSAIRGVAGAAGQLL